MSKGLVVVTGASGFIAKHIVLQLLDEGFHVRAGVRSDAREAEVRSAMDAHVREKTNLDQRLTFTRLDLTRDEGWESALKGADALVHTASPFPLVQPKNEADVIGPAVDGTLRALRAAIAANVSRVILTSSVYAVMLAPETTKGALDETDWSDLNDPRATPYAKSNILAEKAAWDFVATEAPGMKLTAINPGFVIGAPLDMSFGTSLRVIQRLLEAKDPALPNFGFPIVDVRDAAAMHVATLMRPETAGRRYLGGDEFLWFPDMAEILKQAFPDRRIVTRRAPNLLIRLVALFDAEVRTIVPALGRRITVTSERARRELGIAFRPAKDAVISAGAFLLSKGRI